jgi:RNA polymerase subunit RPABC4/transcription elongation factor Spt4
MYCNDCNRVIPQDYANVGICPWCLDSEEDTEDYSDIINDLDLEEDYEQ